MKLVKFILVTLIITGMLSCTDWLDIKPQNETVLEDFWNEERDVEQVVATCYREMQEDAFIKSLIVWGELRSENIVEGSSTGQPEKEMILENILPSNANCKWEKFYSLINYCNTVLHYGKIVLEKDPNFTPSALRAYNAEVLTLRALSYFYLVRTFKNVPYIDLPSIDESQGYQVEQSSDIEILTSVIKDLERAEQDAVIAFSNQNYNKGRVTKNAVRALLADIYLWMASQKTHTEECSDGCKFNYLENCIMYCDRIINDKANDVYRYQLEEKELYSNPYLQIFGNGNSMESIFELQFSSGIKGNSNVSDLYGKFDRVSGRFAASNILNTDSKIFGIGTKDSRRYDSFIDKDQNGTFNIFKYAGLSRIESTDVNNKTVNIYYYRSSSANWIIYRLPEIMLIKAEALTLLNRNEEDLKGALEIVNIINRRSNPQLISDPFLWDAYGTQDKMEELILEERHREFLFEGRRWFDLLRYTLRNGDNNYLAEKVVRKQNTNQITIKNKFKDVNALYLPIHETDLKANEKLVQNPFYDYTQSTEK